MRTVIAIFRNEEYLLPFWLSHHREIFDHGVMIDDHSTDASREIIRDMTPHWEIASANRDEGWDPIDEDFERMTHEARFEGWKITLNITEFLCAESLDKVEARVEKEGLQGAHARGVLMADPLSETLPPPDPEKPLIEQRAFGHYEDEISWGGFFRRHGVHLIKPRYASTQRTMLRTRPLLYKKETRPLLRARLYHRARHGAYYKGRHATQLGRLCAAPQDDMLCLHYYFSPWNEEMRRRARRQGDFSDREKALNPKTPHLLYARSLEALEQTRRRLAKKSRDLSKDEVFQRNALAL